ncbi:hypothetical protein B0O99DRAFT_666494 [Bisporella sp. PMI_857]|nr:hypothetical protein B0O99DRAFT_666494 [Bisporella sp. PMI_857]
MPPVSTFSVYMAYHSVADYMANQQNQHRMKKTAALGCMAGSAFASPVLYEIQNIRLFITRRYNCKLPAVLPHRYGVLADTIRYGPWVLALYTLLGLAAYSSAQTTLPQLVPWIPISICVCLLLTVFLAPKLRRISLSAEDPSNLLFPMEEGRLHTPTGYPDEEESVQTNGAIYNQQERRQTTLWLLNHLTSYMMGPPASPLSGGSHHDSSIFLDDDQHMVSQEDMANSAPATSNLQDHDENDPSQGNFRDDPSHPVTDAPRSISPESYHVQSYFGDPENEPLL